MVMDYILGGGTFGTRLTEEMRVKRGLTYGVYTYLAPDSSAASTWAPSPARTSASPRPSASCAPNGPAWPSTA